MALPALHVGGPNIVDSNGKITKLPGFTAFALFKRYLMNSGWDALVLPNLVEWRGIATEAGYGNGPIALRVFRFAANNNSFALNPWSYTPAQVTEFCNKVGEKGFYIDWTCGDAQQCFPSADPHMGEVNGPIGINQHNNVFCAALVGTTNCIWNTCNEPFQNGIDVNAVKPPPWAPAVRYSGMYFANPDDYGTSADLSAINLHTERGDLGNIHKWVGNAHEAAPYLWPQNKPIIYDEPMGADEVVIPGRRSNVPYYFGILGTSIAMVSGVYFHSTDGLACNGLRPVTRNCAIEFFRGVKGGLLV